MRGMNAGQLSLSAGIPAEVAVSGSTVSYRLPADTCRCLTALHTDSLTHSLLNINMHTLSYWMHSLED